VQNCLMQKGFFREAVYLWTFLLTTISPLVQAQQMVTDALFDLRGHAGLAVALTNSPDGRYVASGGQDSTIKIWEAKTGALLRSWKAHADVVSALAFSPEGNVLISSSPDRMIKLWDPSQGRLVKSFVDTSAALFSVAISNDANFIAASGTDNFIKLWRSQTGERSFFPSEHTDWISALCLSGNGNLLASASYDGTVKLWDFKTARLQKSLTGRLKRVNAVDLSKDEQTLACGGSGGIVEIWKFPDLQEGRTLPAGAGEILTLDFSSNNKWLAAGATSGEIYLWETTTLAALPKLQVDAGSVTRLLFTGGQQSLLWAGTKGNIKVWRLRENGPPTIAVHAPSQGVTLDNTFTLDATITDDWGVDSVIVKVNGEPLILENYQWNSKAPEAPLGRKSVGIERSAFGKLKMGENSFQIFASDFDGQNASSKSVITYRPRELMEEAPALVAEGERLYKKAKFKEAIAKLQQALNIFVKYPSSEYRDPPLIKAHIFTGCAYLGLKNNGQAEQSFKEALKLDPNINLAPSAYSPKIRKFFDRVAGR